MKKLRATNRMAMFIILAALAVGMPQFSAHGQDQTTFGTDVLFRVEVKGPIQTIGLPIYANLRDAAGNDYALVIASLKQITGTGLSYQILDDPASPGAYYLALERRKGARQSAAGLFTILYDDGQRLLVKGGPEVADKLSGMGFDIKMVPTKPMIFRIPFDIKMVPTTPDISRTPQVFSAQTLAAIYDPRVAAMINQVQENILYEETGNLSGENAVAIGGSPYTITRRYTASGVPIEKATQYVYERMEALGLTVSYHNWSMYLNSSRNVVGAKTGKTRPTEIVLITAHLDDVPSSGLAPGADDNASGSAALLMAAEIMSSSSFERTIRFVFFTGEEQGLFGSTVYAAAAFSANENIVAVYNMDMISWDAIDGPTLRLHTRTSSNPGYNADMAIASTFSYVVTSYSLSSVLIPIITSDGENASDHSSFWDNGYAAILAIEDDKDDFTPYYHTANDTRQSLNMTYFTNFTKASVGTAAHLALPIDPLPPTDLTGSALSGREIALSWTDNTSDETGFKIERKTGINGTYSEIATVGANITSYNDTGCGDETTYYYKVRAYNEVGNSAYSNETNATTLLAAPSSLSALPASATQINLSWIDNSSHEPTFTIERATVSGGPYAEIGAAIANRTTYNDKGLTPGKTYYYRVRAHNADGDSNYSNEALATLIIPFDGDSSGACFIATAAFGTPLEKHVQTIRSYDGNADWIKSSSRLKALNKQSIQRFPMWSRGISTKGNALWRFIP